MIIKPTFTGRGVTRSGGTIRSTLVSPCSNPRTVRFHINRIGAASRTLPRRLPNGLRTRAPTPSSSTTRRASASTSRLRLPMLASAAESLHSAEQAIAALRSRSTRHRLSRHGARGLRCRRRHPPIGRAALQRDRPADERRQVLAARRRASHRRPAWPQYAPAAGEAVSQGGDTAGRDQRAPRTARPNRTFLSRRRQARGSTRRWRTVGSSSGTSPRSTCAGSSRGSRRAGPLPPPGSRRALRPPVAASERGEPRRAHRARGAHGALRDWEELDAARPHLRSAVNADVGVLTNVNLAGLIREHRPRGATGPA